MALRGQGSTVIVLNKMAVILRKFGFSILSSDPFLDFLDRTSLIYLIYLYRFDESKDILFFLIWKCLRVLKIVEGIKNVLFCFAGRERLIFERVQRSWRKVSGMHRKRESHRLDSRARFLLILSLCFRVDKSNEFQMGFRINCWKWIIINDQFDTMVWKNTTRTEWSKFFCAM